MIKEYKLKYEILVAGLYPFKEDYSLNGYTLRKNIIENEKFKDYIENDIIYISPLIGFCCCNTDKNTVYLTFEKEKNIKLDIKDNENKKTVAKKLLEHDLLKEPRDLEKYLVLNVNNSIMFPIIIMKLFDMDDNLITRSMSFAKLNVPSLIGQNINLINEKMTRQNFRLNSGFSYESLIGLRNNNSYFDRALSLYYSSFSVNDEKIGFVLLITALETLLNLSTYAKVKKCEKCSQKIYQISETVATNVNLLLMDKTGKIKEIIKKNYNKRSKYLHGTKVEITTEDEQKLQEYVRKVLLMYWFISTAKKTFVHKEIVNEFQLETYNTKFEYSTFLTTLNNTSFEQKQSEILIQIFNEIKTKIKLEEKK